jgi:hypothetical protein
MSVSALTAASTQIHSRCCFRHRVAEDKQSFSRRLQSNFSPGASSETIHIDEDEEADSFVGSLSNEIAWKWF